MKPDKEPWPGEGIKYDSSINDYTWGYLIVSGEKVHWDSSIRPTDDEIISRWGGYFIKCASAYQGLEK